MKLVVGLGNPGEEYRMTRHNVGFEVVDELVQHKCCYSGLAPLMARLNKSLKSEILECEIEDKNVILAKPQTFMNDSGIAVKKLVVSYQLSVVGDLIVVHDDISLELGQVKISKGAGAGNHNGVQSIINHLKTQDFIRVRCGIGRGEGILHDVVLSKFTPDEKETVEQMVKKASEACVMIVEEGLEKAMNEVN